MIANLGMTFQSTIKTLLTVYCLQKTGHLFYQKLKKKKKRISYNWLEYRLKHCTKVSK